MLRSHLDSTYTHLQLTKQALQLPPLPLLSTPTLGQVDRPTATLKATPGDVSSLHLLWQLPESMEVRRTNDPTSAPKSDRKETVRSHGVQQQHSDANTQRKTREKKTGKKGKKRSDAGATNKNPNSADSASVLFWRVAVCRLSRMCMK